MPILTSKESGQIDSERTFVLTGMEQHVYSYPSRAIRTKDFLYIRNFASGDWPTGEVDGGKTEYDFAASPWPTEPGAFSFNVDPSPTKQFLRLHREEGGVKRFAQLAFGRRAAEELYDLSRDPEQLQNVADESEYAAMLNTLRQQLNVELERSGDPRATARIAP